jgi:H/ACA ribonucleoprotein complex subunit 4
LNDGITKDDLVAIMSLKGELLALGKAEISSNDMMNQKKGLAVSVHKVFVKPGTYPKI